MTDLLEKKPAVEKIVRPARQWRNQYLAIVDLTFNDAPPVAAGKIYLGTRVWPSKDIAESVAAQKYDSRGVVHHTHRGNAEYLGAFPVT